MFYSLSRMVFLDLYEQEAAGCRHNLQCNLLAAKDILDDKEFWLNFCQLNLSLDFCVFCFLLPESAFVFSVF